MRLKAKLPAPRLNLNAYKQALFREFERAISEAAEAWVMTAITVIPIWSGASHATFRHLVGNLPIDPVNSAPDRTSLGERLSSGGITSDSTGIFSFAYSTELPHLVYNESINANENPDPALFSRLLNPGPYGFVDMANAAAESVLSSIRIPGPIFTIVTKNV